MSLLSDLQAHSMDDGYAAAARRREHREHHEHDEHGAHGERPVGTDLGSRVYRGLLPAAGLVVAVALGLVLTTAVLDVRARQAGSERSELVREVRDRTDGVAAQQDRLEQLRADLRTLRDDQLALTATGSAGAARLERLGIIAGEIPVRGPGVQVDLDDARPASGEGLEGNDPAGAVDSDASRVRDIDLQVTVNGLWAAGAEAVTVNGQRLTALTSIRAAGAAILVDYQPLEPPYVVRALGDPGPLESGFAGGFAGRWLASAAENDGVRYAVAQQDRLTLPGAALVTLRHATPAPPTPAPTPSPTPTPASGAP